MVADRVPGKPGRNPAGEILCPGKIITTGGSSMDQMNVEELKAWMTQMEKTNKAQKRYAALQCWFSLLTCLFTGAFLVVAIVLGVWAVPKGLDVIKRTDAVLTKMETSVDNTVVIIDNLEKITSELADANLVEMLDQVNVVVTDSQKGIKEAMEKVEAIDIEKMNQGISDLCSVIAPLAKLFGGGKN